MKKKNSKTGTFEATIPDPRAQHMPNFITKNHQNHISYLLTETTQKQYL